MDTILEINNLRTYFFTDESPSYAVDGVGFDLRRGEALGLVGESGCGKSVTALSILRLVPKPGKIVSGEVLFHQKDLLKLPDEKMREIRGDRISIIFQEPAIAFNPLYTIGYQIEEAMRVHQKRDKVKEEAIKLLERVRMPDPVQHHRSYPHELSGGMQQRAMIAMALSCHPEILIADEPTTALDVTVQAQIMDLFGEFKKEGNMALLLITHDLGVVSELADRIAVMYAGIIVEIGPQEKIMNTPLHPYTKGLLGASLNIKKKKEEPLPVIPGKVPLFQKMREGCPFFTRCDFGDMRCKRSQPQPIQIEKDWWVWCWKT